MIQLLFLTVLVQNLLPTVPGHVDPHVTQANLQSTICKHGYTKTVRPASKFTTTLKIKQLAELGLKGKPSDYEEDHRLPLEVGGAPMDPMNLWPELWPEARKKDKLENAIKRDVCSGKITLLRGQAIFLGDFWKEYERRYSATKK